MSEQEAKTKWCPFARVVHSSDTDGGLPVIIRQHPAFNRIGGKETSLPVGSLCIGSACMAWRETKGDEEPLIEAVRRYRNENGASLKDAKEYVETHPEYRRGTPDGGFCGLAGKP